MHFSPYSFHAALAFFALTSVGCIELDTNQNGSGGMGGGATGGGGAASGCYPRVCNSDVDCSECRQIDVFSRSLSPASGPQLVHAIGRPGRDSVIVGDFVGTLDIGSGKPSSIVNDTGFERPFAASVWYDGSGQWMTDFGAMGRGSIRDAYITPKWSDTFAGGVEIVGGVHTATVYKLRSGALLDWKVGFGSSQTGQNNEITSISVDDGGDVVVAGFFLGSFTLSCALPGQMPSDVNINASSSLVVVKLNGNTGQCQWATAYGGGVSTPTGITTIALNGSVVVTGVYQGDLLVDGMAVLPGGALGSTFVVALDTVTGKHKWAKAFLSSGAPAVPSRIVMFDDKQLVTTGYISSDAVDFGDPTNPIVLEGNGINPYVVAMDITGKTLWATRMPGKNARGHSITAGIDPYGGMALYLAGISFGGPTMLDEMVPSTTLCPMGGMFLVRLDFTTGKPRWGNCFGTVPDESLVGSLSAFVAMGENDLALAGSMKGVIDFGSGPMGSATDVYPNLVFSYFSPLP